MQAGDVKFPRVALFRAVIFIRQVSSALLGISGLALQLLGTLTRPGSQVWITQTYRSAMITDVMIVSF
jgi:hypothetical protein